MKPKHTLVHMDLISKIFVGKVLQFSDNFSFFFTVCTSNLYLGSSASFATSVNLNLTPVPSRKFSFQGVGGVYHPGHPVSETGTDLLNLCRICQLPGEGEGYYGGRSATGDILFSPCRCSGSLKYVHYSCLLVSG